ncbi:MAG: hypothetical protein WDN49_17175 [Acetobacteraceae bacterium]
MTAQPGVTTRLYDVAHARAGDKGNRSNISLIPYDPRLYPLLAAQVTEARVLALFAHRGATRVVRYDLPNLHAFNFVIDDVLEGRRERRAQPRWPRQVSVIPTAGTGGRNSAGSAARWPAWKVEGES